MDARLGWRLTGFLRTPGTAFLNPVFRAVKLQSRH